MHRNQGKNSSALEIKVGRLQIQTLSRPLCECSGIGNWRAMDSSRGWSRLVGERLAVFFNKHVFIAATSELQADILRLRKIIPLLKQRWN